MSIIRMTRFIYYHDDEHSSAIYSLVYANEEHAATRDAQLAAISL